MDALEQFLNENKITFREHETLAELTSFKIGGRTGGVFYPQNADQAAAIIRFAAEKGKKLLYFGNGSNILGRDEGCSCLILKTTELSELKVDAQGLLTVGAGVKLAKASSFAAQRGFSGLEFAYGIPGTVGGAVFMNAGAYDGAMDQVVVSTQYLDEDAKQRELAEKEHTFGYRKSFFMNRPGCLILSAKMQLHQGEKAKILAKMEDFQQRRKEKQPLEYPSAGSIFKRPQGTFAGKLIDEAGLRGTRIGDAQVSEKHCGFIINLGHATGADVRALIAYVQKRVWETSGIFLECEVRDLGTK